MAKRRRGEESEGRGVGESNYPYKGRKRGNKGGRETQEAAVQAITSQPTFFSGSVDEAESDPTLS